MTKIDCPSRIRYDEGCLAAHALNQIGDRWALLVLRELVFTPKRFQMLRAGLPGITAGVLTARLHQMIETGLVFHDPRLGAYGLTERGRGVLPVLEALCRWALSLPGHDPSRFISPTALMISMGVNLQRHRAAGAEFHAGFDFGREAFEMRLAQGRLQTAAVLKPEGQFILGGDANRLASAVYGPKSLSELVAAGKIEATGDLEAAQRFVDLFALAPQDEGLSSSSRMR